MDMNLSKFRGDSEGRKPGLLQPMGSQKVGRDLATERQHRFQKALEKVTFMDII